jgi:hypothetical protein
MFIKIRTLLITVSISAALVFFITTAIGTNGVVVYRVSAQTNNSNTTNNKNMEFVMSELAKIHLMTADQALMKGNTTEAFSQMNLAYLQLSMLGMKNMGMLNETQAMKFMQGAEKGSNIKMVPDNCIIIHGGVLECRDILTGSYSLAK